MLNEKNSAGFLEIGFRNRKKNISMYKFSQKSQNFITIGIKNGTFREAKFGPISNTGSEWNF